MHEPGRIYGMQGKALRHRADPAPPLLDLNQGMGDDWGPTFRTRR